MKTTLRDWQARPFMPHADMQGEYCKLTPLCPGAHGGVSCGMLLPPTSAGWIGVICLMDLLPTSAPL